jgi:hypothetical protein
VTRRQEFICAVALLLWAVICGNWTLEGRIARAERKYMDHMDFVLVCLDAETRRIEKIHAAYAEKTREVFGYEQSVLRKNTGREAHHG